MPTTINKEPRTTGDSPSTNPARPGSLREPITISRIFFSGLSAKDRKLAIKPYTDPGAACRVCGCSGVPEGYVKPTGVQVFSKNFTDFPKFKRNDRSEVCVPCAVMVKTSLKAGFFGTFVVAGGHLTGDSAKMSSLRKVFLDPPEPPFIIAMQRTPGAKAGRPKHILLGGSIGDDRDFFPVNTPAGAVWIDRPLAVAFTETALRLMKEWAALKQAKAGGKAIKTAGLNKYPAYQLLRALAFAGTGTAWEELKKKAVQWNVPFTQNDIDRLTALGGGQVSVLAGALLAELCEKE